MSFTVSVKQELNRLARERQCCRTAELASLFRATGSFHIMGGRQYGLTASFGLSATARNAVQLVRSFNLPLEVRVHEERRLGPHKRYEIRLEGGARLVQFLNEIGVLADDLSLQAEVPQRILARPCCRGAMLRGAFLAAGSVSAPGAPAHLEVYSTNSSYLDSVRKAADSLGVPLSSTERRRSLAIYTKNLKVIKDFLAAVGAHQSLLELEQRSILSTVTADANRRANFDQANAARCSRAAARQVRAIRQLQSRQSWVNLSDRLVEVAELRLENPSLTIAELGRRADPPLSKSAVNHRLRRLVKMAESPDR